MEKNRSFSFGKVLGVIGLLAGAGILVWKNYKKSLVEIQKEHDEVKDHLTELGLSETEAEEIIEAEENGETNDISLLAFRLVTKGRSKYCLSDEFTDVESAINSTNVIHVRTTEDQCGVEIIYQIPDIAVVHTDRGYANISSAGPRCIDYMQTLGDYSNRLKEKLGVNISRSLAGFVRLSWQAEDGETIYDIVEISRWPKMYSDETEDPNRALTSLYERYRKNGNVLDEDVVDELHYKLDEQIDPDFKIVRFYLGVKLYAPQAGANRNGITYEDVASIVQDSIDGPEPITVKQSERSTEFTQYDHVMFHAPAGPGQGGNLTIVYDWAGKDVKTYDIIYYK